MSGVKDEGFTKCKETQPIWDGNYVVPSFREKVEKVLKESSSESAQLKGERCNVTRIKRVWSCKSTLKLVEEWRSIISQPQRLLGLTKCGEMSNKLRQEGNEYYKRKMFRMAQKGFTLSLCFAPIDSKEQVLAYSNRSASFMEMGEKENCLSDICKALEVLDGSEFSHRGELESVRVKLVERRSRCVTDDANEGTKSGRDENGNEHHQYFTLQNPSKVIEAAEDFVEIQDKPGRGRHVTVTKDVNPGTIIILEEPYSKVLVKQFRWEIDFCHYCFKCISNSPSVACTRCVFAVYCNYNCLLLDSAQHDFYECKIAGFLHELQLKRLVHLAYRTIIKMGPKNLYEFWKKDKSSKNTSQKILGFDEEGRYLSSSYYSIFCLIYHDTALHEEELREYATDAILLIELLDEKTDFFKSIHYDDSEDSAAAKKEVQDFKYFAASIILLHQMNFPCNAHSLNFIKLPNKHPSPDDIVKASTTDFGAGAFALLSMINHSCEPNVVRISLINGVNAVIAIKKISSGDEILDNYGVHFALQDYPERAGHLQSYYHFTCNCIACKNKWPQMDALQRMENRFMCQNCSSQFSVGDYVKKSFQDCIIDKSKNWCKKCGANYDFAILQKDLGNCTDEFHTAYDLLLENRPLQCIPTLIKCLTYVESHVLPPCITANFIQETLKQAFNLLAINYYEN